MKRAEVSALADKIKGAFALEDPRMLRAALRVAAASFTIEKATDEAIKAKFVGAFNVSAVAKSLGCTPSRVSKLAKAVGCTKLGQGVYQAQ